MDEAKMIARLAELCKLSRAIDSLKLSRHDSPNGEHDHLFQEYLRQLYNNRICKDLPESNLMYYFGRANDRLVRMIDSLWIEHAQLKVGERIIWCPHRCPHRFAGVITMLKPKKNYDFYVVYDDRHEEEVFAQDILREDRPDETYTTFCKSNGLLLRRQ